MKSKLTIGKLLLGALYAGIIVAVILAAYFTTSREKAIESQVILGGERVSVAVADTQVLREQGLSGRKDLKPAEGMLFIFPQSGPHAFWMKDMLFPIDIIWFDEKLQIVDVWENAQPESYPRAFTPRAPAKYVLEVSSGYSSKHALKVGDVLELELHSSYNR